ncbi:MAG: hypothetical protein KAR84_08010, partial [Elusimicrobiales bacterium]|nr:hypothetical protein [Elusimicrobiales bacterium]
KLPPLPQFDESRVKLAKTNSAPRVKMNGAKLSMNVVGRNKNTRRRKTGGRGANLLSGRTPEIDLKQQELEGTNLDKLISIPNPVQGYRVQVANDKDFVKIKHDKEYDVFDDVDFSDLLPPGRYWIRISYIDLLGFEGKFNKPRIIIIK